MLGLKPRSHVNVITATSEKIGATLPEPVVVGIGRAEKVTAGARTIHPGRDAVTAAVIRALDAGKDPAADREVQRTYIATQIVGAADGLAGQVEAEMYDDLAVICREHADAIIESWRAPFDAAAVSIVKAHDVIGPLPLKDTVAILAKGGEAATAWGEANKAQKTIDDIATAWTALARLTRFAEVNTRFPALRFAHYTPEQWDGSVDRQNLTAWDVLLTGGRLDLADGPEYARRVQAIVRAEQEAAAARQREGQRQMAGSSYMG